MKKINKILCIALIVLYVFLNHTKVKFNHKYGFEINGLVWVALDYYTIWKYESNDKPIDFITIYY